MIVWASRFFIGIIIYIILRYIKSISVKYANVFWYNLIWKWRPIKVEWKVEIFSLLIMYCKFIEAPCLILHCVLNEIPLMAHLPPRDEWPLMVFRGYITRAAHVAHGVYSHGKGNN